MLICSPFSSVGLYVNFDSLSHVFYIHIPLGLFMITCIGGAPYHGLLSGDHDRDKTCPRARLVSKLVARLQTTSTGLGGGDHNFVRKSPFED